MIAYWIDFIRILLPGFLIMLISALPLAIGTGLAVIDLRRDKPRSYRRNFWSSIAAGIVALGLLWSYLFGKSLSSSSTAGLIFIFVPIYSAAGFGVGYGLSALVQLAYQKMTGNSHVPGEKPTLSWYEKLFIGVPITLLVILLFGMLKLSVRDNEMAMAEKAINPEILHELHQKALNGTADSFSVPLFLAQNPNTPADILEELSKHYHSSVRIFVVRHPNASEATLNNMINDRSHHIREEARARVQKMSESASHKH